MSSYVLGKGELSNLPVLDLPTSGSSGILLTRDKMKQMDGGSLCGDLRAPTVPALRCSWKPPHFSVCFGRRVGDPTRDEQPLIHLVRNLITRFKDSFCGFYLQTHTHFNKISNFPLCVFIVKKSTGFIDSDVTVSASSAFGHSMKKRATVWRSSILAMF